MGRAVQVSACADLIRSAFAPPPHGPPPFQANFRHSIEARRMLGQGALQDGGLLWCGLQLYDHGPVHAESISYICQLFNTEKAVALPPTLESCGCPRRINHEQYYFVYNTRGTTRKDTQLNANKCKFE